MKILLATLLLALSGFAQPFIRPSYAYMAAQSGTIGRKEIQSTLVKYAPLGCSYIGITDIDENTVNVWCVVVEVLY